MVAMLASVAMVPRTGQAQQPGDPFGNILLGPAVRIASPANHSVFSAPVDIPIFIFTRSEADFTNVEVYANGVDIGPATSLATTARPLPYFSYTLTEPALLAARFRSLWCLVWSNVPPTNYTLTAVGKAFGALGYEEGLGRTSAPVNITVLASNSVVNAPDVVNIIATDPIAISGTNSYWLWPGLTNPVPAWTNWPPPHWGYFTNWGPKTALMTVSRYGDVTSDLTVNYNIGGTASNGVDYVTLPGYVNIAAGAACGLIPIVPIDNGSNTTPKTVVLTLAPSTNLPPNYFVGIPRQAEAIIFHLWPRPTPILWPAVPPFVASALPDGTVHISTAGPDGAWFTVQSSPDLVNWSCIATNQVVQGSVDFVDPGAAGNATGFYQVVPLTNSPAQ
jgi:hypothetical protein